MRISGTDIYIAQGDTAKLTLIFDDAEDQTVEFYLNTDTEEPFDTATVTSKKAVFTLFADLDPGEYYYDVVLIHGNLEDPEDPEDPMGYTTIIRKALFVVEETARTHKNTQYSSSSF